MPATSTVARRAVALATGEARDGLRFILRRS